MSDTSSPANAVKKKTAPRPLELLAPAANKEVARQAILHGADAVYMGASSHGARSKAANSMEDIRETVEFAHRFRARVYVTVNTLIYENEIPQVEKLIRDLYLAGVDALIVQDMSVLSMDIPPIELHASTQCDTRTPAKARFLQGVGFSQIVLARELTLDEIADVCHEVSVPVECFVHGALCVCYSGRCIASEACLGRSANRGECAQMCRMPYTLRNAEGKVLLKDRHLLSLSDFNASSLLKDMVEAGVSSFKIEGRLKDAAYVKNITAAYRRMIDDIIAAEPDKYVRSSYGRSAVSFTSELSKSFNRGFTTYFLGSRRPGEMASLFTPKSQGEPISDISQINNGDGISWLNPRTLEYEGTNVNRVERGRIITPKPVNIPKGAELRRTFDREWQQLMESNTADRRIAVDIEIDLKGVSARDERGVAVRIPLECAIEEARRKMDPRPVFAKLGNTVYTLHDFTNNLPDTVFIPASALTALRRRLTDALDKANIATYPFHYRRPESADALFPSKRLIATDNVANSLARNFYRRHGVEQMEEAIEISSRNGREKICKTTPLMKTRYCLRRELGLCKRDGGKSRLCLHGTNKPLAASDLKEPLTISSGPHTFRLHFDCTNCEMQVYAE